jgi:hypothetical protein
LINHVFREPIPDSSSSDGMSQENQNWRVDRPRGDQNPWDNEDPEHEEIVDDIDWEAAENDENGPNDYYWGDEP